MTSLKNKIEVSNQLFGFEISEILLLILNWSKFDLAKFDGCSAISLLT